MEVSQQQVHVRGVLGDLIAQHRPLFQGMNLAGVGFGPSAALVEGGQKNDEKGHIIGQGHLTGGAVFLLQRSAQAAVVSLVFAELFNLQLRFANRNVSKHNFTPSKPAVSGRQYTAPAHCPPKPEQNWLSVPIIA